MLAQNKIICGILICYLNAGVFIIALSQESRSFELDGFIEFDHISYFEKKPDQVINSRNQGLFQLDLSFEFAEKASVFLSTEFREDFSDYSRNRIFPKEYYVNLYFKHIDVGLGKQRYYWGRVDGFNPTNNLNPVDYSDMIDTDDEEIGVLSANATFFYRKWSLQAVFVPVFTPSIHPQINSVWFPQYPQTMPNPDIPGQYINLSYQFLPAENPKKDLSSAQFAAKIDASYGGVDFSTSYYQGYSHIPEYTKTEIPITNDSIQVQIKAIHVPWTVIGADIATSLGPIDLRGEAAYFITKGEESVEANSKDNYIQFTVGADYMVFLGQSNSSFLFLAEWVQEVVPSGFQYPVTSLNHLFQKAILARIEYNYRNIPIISFQALYDIKSNGYYLQPKISYDPIDGLNLILLADFLGGDRTGFFGMYSGNDRIQIKIKYSF